MNKVYLNKAGENWVVDRFRREWYSEKSEISSRYAFNASSIWLIAPWTWKKMKKKHLEKKRVICTIHHIDEDKFDENAKKDFYSRDKFVDIYHAISLNTKNQLSKYTKKPIVTIPFWINNNIWFQIHKKEYLFEKYKLPNDSFLIGSFQRDTEGHDLQKPKLSKGPDQFVEIIKYFKISKKNIHIILTGKRRDYLLRKLEEIGVDYSYFKMTNFKELNELYNCLDLYVVASRVEGGPQSIMECGLNKTPIISTNVGIAPEILSPESIFNMTNFRKAKPNIKIAFDNVQKYLIPKGFDNFIKMLELDNES